MRRALRSLAVSATLFAALPAERGLLPVIDMHLHARHAADQGPAPVVICAPYDTIPARDPRWTAGRYFAGTFGKANCRHLLTSAPDDDALRERSIAYLRRYNVTAVTSGTAPSLERWHKAAPDRIIPALSFAMSDPPSVQSLRMPHRAGRLAVMGEIGAQYDGVAPDDPKMEPYYALEEVLVRHPRLRLYVMPAGWPMADRMIALTYAHPQVYADTGVIDYTQPRAEFWAYLRRLVDAGYGERIMYGSDQMVWPDAIPASPAAIRTAPFVSAAQKRDILRDNAARFLRLDDAPRSAHTRERMMSATGQAKPEPRAGRLAVPPPSKIAGTSRRRTVITPTLIGAQSARPRPPLHLRTRRAGFRDV